MSVKLIAIIELWGTINGKRAYGEDRGSNQKEGIGAMFSFIAYSLFLFTFYTYHEKKA